MIAPATVAIIISTPHGVRQLAGPSERGIAGSAEAILRDLGEDVRSSRFWVQCADAGASQRLTSYLRDVRDEMLGEVEAERHPPVPPEAT